MKKFLFLIFFVGIFIFSTIVVEAAEEVIDDFLVTVKINTDSTVEITEHIKYNFGANQRHGIFRNIPYKYKSKYGNFNLRISDISVFDQNGGKYQYEVSSSGGYKHIKTGDPDVFVTGIKDYVIKYKVARAINFFEDLDEFYWNATGNEWDVAIAKSSATIILPKEMYKQDLKVECYSGQYGDNNNCTIKEVAGVAGMTKQILFSNGFLNQREGLTIAVGLPKGAVAEPSLFKKIILLAIDNGILVLPIIVFVVMFCLWHKKGRDPKGKGTIIAQFDVPDGLTPSEVGTLIDEKANNKDISSEIINLAINGYIKIIQTEKDGLLKKVDYIFEKLRDADGLNRMHEQKLFSNLFRGNKNEVRLSDLQDSFYRDLEKIKKEIYKSLVARGYYSNDPKVVRGLYLTVGIVFFFSGLWLNVFLGAMGMISFFVSGAIIVVFGFFMPAKTKEGVLAHEHILGLKEYLQVAEKDRIEFHNAPEKNPEYFEKMLPLAMALGVEKAWAKQFENIYVDRRPGWYNSYNNQNFSALMLANSLSDFSSQANSVLSSVPASSGGRGSLGGGFSGGGFGGGGGGSW